MQPLGRRLATKRRPGSSRPSGSTLSPESWRLCSISRQALRRSCSLPESASRPSGLSRRSRLGPEPRPGHDSPELARKAVGSDNERAMADLESTALDWKEIEARLGEIEPAIAQDVFRDVLTDEISPLIALSRLLLAL